MEEDRWGLDPQVRYLRRAFAMIEKRQGELLARLGVLPTDYRLRRIRETTLKTFEDLGMTANRRGVVRDEEETAILYIYCLVRVLRANRIPVDDSELPAHEGIARLAKEMLP
ncbi:MAG TPA: hypothetical protein VGJ94_16515 [Syntrophorhabdaceae bacterium]|jgi:hypothetical protein